MMNKSGFLGHGHSREQRTRDGRGWDRNSQRCIPPRGESTSSWLPLSALPPAQLPNWILQNANLVSSCPPSYLASLQGPPAGSSPVPDSGEMPWNSTSWPLYYLHHFSKCVTMWFVMCLISDSHQPRSSRAGLGTERKRTAHCRAQSMFSNANLLSTQAKLPRRTLPLWIASAIHSLNRTFHRT